MGMIERVARAMCQQGGFDPDEQMPNDGPRWRYYVPGARTAIEAMREPTKPMYAAAYAAFVPASDAQACWQAMTDAALAEKGE